MAVSTSYGLAVLLAVAGAALFGLATVRQHGAVQHSIKLEQRGRRQSVQAFFRMVRRPAWLIGTFIGLVAGGLHVVALALAPIALVQPIGVLAVPVTVVITAVEERKRPTRRQVAGSIVSVLSIAALTILLLKPGAIGAETTPTAWSLVVTVAVAVAFTAVAAAVSHGMPPLVRCSLLAASAAVLFGLTSTLIRAAGTYFTDSPAGGDVWVLVSALVGGAVAVPVGVWAMQTAYISGSPHVVICWLTLLDPLAAVTLGRLLLNEGAAMTSATLVMAAGCALLAAFGVVLLARDYPIDESAAVDVAT
jgi:hypothetical protein